MALCQASQIEVNRYNSNRVFVELKKNSTYTSSIVFTLNHVYLKKNLPQIIEFIEPYT